MKTVSRGGHFIIETCVTRQLPSVGCPFSLTSDTLNKGNFGLAGGSVKINTLFTILTSLVNGNAFNLGSLVS